MTNIRIRGVCIDLSGTLHIDDTLTPRALEALQRLTSHPSLQVRFVSNTTKESAATLRARLGRLGVRVGESALFTSLSAAAAVVRKERRAPMLLLAADAATEFAEIPETTALDSVVVGLAPACFDHATLTRAMNVLLQAKAEGRDPVIIATHRGRYFQTNDGLEMGPGPFVAALEYATGIEVRTVGKPEQSFFKLALDDMKLDASECVHIGDDARDDIGGALAAGMSAILVQTGKYRQGDEAACGVTPTATVADFNSAVNLILDSWMIQDQT